MYARPNELMEASYADWNGVWYFRIEGVDHLLAMARIYACLGPVYQRILLNTERDDDREPHDLATDIDTIPGVTVINEPTDRNKYNALMIAN